MQRGYSVEEHDTFFVVVDPNDNWATLEYKSGGMRGTTGGRAAIKMLLRWNRESEGRGKFMDLQFNQCSENRREHDEWALAWQEFMKGYREAAADLWMLPYLLLACAIGTYLSFRINGIADHLRWIDVLFTLPFACVAFWLTEKRLRS